MFVFPAIGQIIKSVFILRCIDQVELRQAIEKQLSKAELANSCNRAVAVGNPRGLEHAEKEAQEIAEGCNRLIKNSIICWNHIYLTRRLETAKTLQERKHILKMIALHSPQTWGHTNMLGEYDLTNGKLQDNTGVLPPKPLSVSSRKIGSRRKGKNANYTGAYCNSLWRNRHLCAFKAIYALTINSPRCGGFSTGPTRSLADSDDP